MKFQVGSLEDTGRGETHCFPLEDVRYFVALARHRSLSTTARVLGVNHATVGP
jgi:hypothetical protein